MSALRLLQSLFTSSPRRAPADCFAHVRTGTAILVDVREPGECRRGVAAQAVLLPLSDLAGRRKRWKPFLAAHGDRELVFYCGAGVRSGMAARTLAAEGFRTVNAGSFQAWADAGWPVVAPTDADVHGKS
ncbi:MAG: rhodanese-like domain-containing protein [Opitutaceae bacterium]|nr:rhodanese-like domain-containing protein [Opitutaceae bacterium]